MLGSINSIRQIQNEYSPKEAAVFGSGEWYINVGKIAKEKLIEKVVEVPDWEDFGFQDLYEEYLDKCGEGILPPDARDHLKKQMQESISKQRALVEQLKQFHTHENDQNENTALLIDIWKKRIGTFEEDMNALKKDCFTPPVPKKPTIAIGKALSIDLGGYIIPDENSDFWDYSRNSWVAGAEDALKKVVTLLNENKSFISKIKIDIDYNCGDPSSMTGNDCDNRGKKLFQNIVKRLYQIRLKIPKEKIQKGKINSFQDLSHPLRGAMIKVIVL